MEPGSTHNTAIPDVTAGIKEIKELNLNDWEIVSDEVLTPNTNMDLLIAKEVPLKRGHIYVITTMPDTKGTEPPVKSSRLVAWFDLDIDLETTGEDKGIRVRYLGDNNEVQAITIGPTKNEELRFIFGRAPKGKIPDIDMVHDYHQQDTKRSSITNLKKVGIVTDGAKFISQVHFWLSLVGRRGWGDFQLRIGDMGSKWGTRITTLKKKNL